LTDRRRLATTDPTDLRKWGCTSANAASKSGCSFVTAAKSQNFKVVFDARSSPPTNLAREVPRLGSSVDVLISQSLGPETNDDLHNAYMADDNGPYHGRETLVDVKWTDGKYSI
jgi:hypothetical protein